MSTRRQEARDLEELKQMSEGPQPPVSVKVRMVGTNRQRRDVSRKETNERVQFRLGRVTTVLEEALHDVREVVVRHQVLRRRRQVREPTTGTSEDADGEVPEDGFVIPPPDQRVDEVQHGPEHPHDRVDERQPIVDVAVVPQVLVEPGRRDVSRIYQSQSVVVTGSSSSSSRIRHQRRRRRRRRPTQRRVPRVQFDPAQQ